MKSLLIFFRALEPFCCVVFLWLALLIVVVIFVVVVVDEKKKEAKKQPGSYFVIDFKDRWLRRGCHPTPTIRRGDILLAYYVGYLGPNQSD